MRSYYSLLLVLLLFFLYSEILAQSDSSVVTTGAKATSAVSAKILTVDYGTPQDLDLDRGFGLELAYHRTFGNYFGIALPLQIQVANVPGTPNNVDIINFDGLLHFFPLKVTSKFSPYVLGGAGISVENVRESGLQYPLGGGLNIRLGENSYANIQGALRMASADNRDNIQWGAGYVYRFSKQDTDGDGISDSKDRCPQLPGPAELAGCPDRDGDGVIDPEDECPTVAGTAVGLGCPDTDGDGITDPKDACPTVAGTLNGCPDTDSDGIADQDDACPEQAGLPENAGCPDSDGDGLFDNLDQCPNEVGPKENKGCPLTDTDGDGIADDMDQCPNEAGPASTRGCPDQDGDGVADQDDRCPEVAGVYAGCPDTDGDGVHDGDDRCPEEKGLITNKGCPEIKEEVQEVLDLAMRAVQFETGSANLKTESYDVLNQIVDILKEYSAYSLVIAGHTDNVGDDASNQILSEQRAKSCFQYLVSKGISPRRMSYAGYGESAPIAQNETAAGRRLNRRVEFELVIR